MDFGTVVIIALLIAAVLIIATVIVMLISKYRADAAAAYDRRMAAEREYDVAILRAAKVLVVGDMAYVTKGVDIHNEIIYDKMPISANGTPITTSTIDGDKITLHQIASRLVDDSITQNGKDATKLLTADEWHTMGHDTDQHKDSIKYLTPLGVYKVNGGDPKSQGTFVKDGMTLQSLLCDLSVNAIPLVTGQTIKR